MNFRSNSWKGLVYKRQDDDKHIHFSKNNVESASNPLLLMNTKQLKKDLVEN
jgi:hypothetical protein